MHIRRCALCMLLFFLNNNTLVSLMAATTFSYRIRCDLKFESRINPSNAYLFQFSLMSKVSYELHRWMGELNIKRKVWSNKIPKNAILFWMKHDKTRLMSLMLQFEQNKLVIVFKKLRTMNMSRMFSPLTGWKDNLAFRLPSISHQK